jgi:hypothetical protein
MIRLGGYGLSTPACAPASRSTISEKGSALDPRGVSRKDDDFGAIVVHGHSISKVVEIKDNRIGIDTGAYCYDTLTAICLE